MAAPTRFQSGFTQDMTWQPLGNIGIPDPFFYAYYEDEFLPYNAALYTVTATGGSVAATAANGAGGRILFTTGTTVGNFGEIQLPVAGLQYVPGKKMAYLTRVRIGQSTNAFVAGLINTTATPFTGGSITDGIYFSSAAGSTTITLTAVTGGTVIGTDNINTPYTVGADFDLGFYVDRLGNIKAFGGLNLVGAKRPNTATLGPTDGIQASNMTGAISTVLLNPTLAVSNGTTAAAGTMVADFMFAGTER